MILVDKESLSDLIKGLGDKLKNLFATKDSVNGIANKYYGTLTVGGWKGNKENLTYYQTVTLTPARDTAPAVTEDSIFLSDAGFDSTGNFYTDAELQTTLDIIRNGITKTGDGTVTVSLDGSEFPESDITCCWTIQV